MILANQRAFRDRPSPGVVWIEDLRDRLRREPDVAGAFTVSPGGTAGVPGSLPPEHHDRLTGVLFLFRNRRARRRAALRMRPVFLPAGDPITSKSWKRCARTDCNATANKAERFRVGMMTENDWPMIGAHHAAVGYGPAEIRLPGARASVARPP